MDKKSRKITAPGYCGRILKGNYTRGLKKRLREYISVYSAYENTGNMSIPYISAWGEEASEIWYEYAGTRLIELLGCRPADVAKVLRESVLDRCIYKYMDDEEMIEKEIRSQREIMEYRHTLRDTVEDIGVIDAVYKISSGAGGVFWLKDLASVESHKDDGIFLSLGSCMVVTKEMRAEEERVRREKLQALLETAGAVCHELNQPIQAISGYCEALMNDTHPGDRTRERIQRIAGLTKKMGDITKKLKKTTRYQTKDYIKGVRIVDIEKSSEDGI